MREELTQAESVAFDKQTEKLHRKLAEYFPGVPTVLTDDGFHLFNVALPKRHESEATRYLWRIEDWKLGNAEGFDDSADAFNPADAFMAKGSDTRKLRIEQLAKAYDSADEITPPEAGYDGLLALIESTPQMVA